MKAERIGVVVFFRYVQWLGAAMRGSARRTKVTPSMRMVVTVSGAT